MSFTLILNVIIIFIILLVVFALIRYRVKNYSKLERKLDFERDKARYSVDTMKEFIKKKFDEITKMNLYDLALSEEEFERRKNIKYELKRALKNASYADVNDKRYVKSLMFDLLRNNYGLNERNINYAISFDDISSLTSQDKFEIMMHEYRKTYKDDSLTEFITKYSLDEPKYEFDETIPSYVITKAEIETIFDKEMENFDFNFIFKI